MLIIPLQPVPNQALRVQLAQQDCQVNVYTKIGSVFVDLYLNNVLLIGGVIAQNLNPIVRSVYLGFSGDLAFIDNEGSDDPIYTGLGSRFSLAYVTAEELTA
jgi:hypothetical protein